jgi:hypothetical protein
MKMATFWPVRGEPLGFLHQEDIGTQLVDELDLGSGARVV